MRFNKRLINASLIAILIGCGGRCASENSKAEKSSQSDADVLNSEQFQVLQEWQKGGRKVINVQDLKNTLDSLKLMNFRKVGNQFESSNYILSPFAAKLILFLKDEGNKYEVITVIEVHSLIDSLHYRGIFVKDLNGESKNSKRIEALDLGPTPLMCQGENSQSEYPLQ